MTSILRRFYDECSSALKLALEKTFPEWAQKVPNLSIPPNLDFGQLSSSIAHEIARTKKKTPSEVAQKICDAMQISENTLITRVRESAGYVNFDLNYEKATPLLFQSILADGEHYGMDAASERVSIAVEHTSANPSGPLTMGHARNTILGDALARLLAARGHDVKTRFYIDDVGRQVSILAYGFKLLNSPKLQEKSDVWLGRLYACTNCAVQLESIKRKMSISSAADDNSKLQKELDEWVEIAAELDESNKDLFTQVLEAVRNRDNPETDIQALGRDYERREESVSKLIREVSQLALNGIRSTLTEMDISFDYWDWESQLIWDGKVQNVIDNVRKLPFAKTEELSLSLDVNAIVEEYSLRGKYNLAPNYEVPPLTLIRSDGSTLYPTRDIAYTLFKFIDSERVINVIASEQSLPQLQIRLALYAMGEKEISEKLIHYAYGLVELPGMKMSKRRARFIALDDVIEQARKKVQETIAMRGGEEMNQEEAQRIGRAIALGAIKFALLNISSAKNLTFTWDRVLSLERNSAPFINYAYTRAGSILRKLGREPANYNLSALTHPLERLLIFKIAQMPLVFCEAADQLKPEELANYANVVAEKFHEYYEKVDVIHAEEQVRNARAMLVKSVQLVLRNSMELLGVKLTERM
ncbi:MAG: arginine--tRNA ligase [Candidatus Bathyarchaeia archaeon]